MPAAARSWPASANVIVLSADRTLIDLLRDSLAGMHRVWRADDEAHAEELIVEASNAVFLVDASLADCDTRALVNRVHQQFPDLAIIVAGRRDDEALFAPIVTSGVIFRCLPSPASAECILNLVDATQRLSRRKTDLPAAAPRTALSAVITGTHLAIKLLKLTLPKISVDREWVRRWSRRCLLLVPLLLTVWALSQWRPWNYAAGLFARQEPAPAAPVDIGSDSKLLKLLDDAGIALTQDRLVDPPGQNALELYRAALALDPDNDLAQSGIDSVADKLLAEAERALQARDMPRLASAVDAARSARAGSPAPGILFAAAQARAGTEVWSRKALSREHRRQPLIRGAAEAALRDPGAQSARFISGIRTRETDWSVPPLPLSTADAHSADSMKQGRHEAALLLLHLNSSRPRFDTGDAPVRAE